MEREASRRGPASPPLTADAAQARVLLDPLARRVLDPFFGGGASVGGAAAYLGVKANTLLRQVRRLVGLHLLEVVRVEARAGRAIKRYQVTSQQFFVPFGVTDALTLEDLLLRAVEEPNRVIARALARQHGTEVSRLGYLVHRPVPGCVVHDLSLDGHTRLSPVDLTRPWLRDGRTLRLSPGRAQALVRDLLEVLDRYDDVQGEPYQVFVAFAPLEGE